jgi:4-amino-4-deoxy-L-arabinose transferase-like glycosyltransferase
MDPRRCSPAGTTLLVFALPGSGIHSPAMPELLDSSIWRRIVLAFVIVLFAITNLPWTLDDYDQAKQAYTSFEMVRQGDWLYQHTPNENVATKPPLIGWISAAIYQVTRWWEGAWRLPSLGAALLLLWLIARHATAAYGASAGLIALSAFGLNLLSPRLATLVRTDMPLALVTYLIGAQIWWKIRRAEIWTTRDRGLAFLLLTAAMLIKGPIVYAFVLPGLVVYEILRPRKGVAPAAWSGWWPWIFSLAVFLLWVWGGVVRQPGFYESVVVREFAGRFTETFHKPQPFYFYFPHLLHKFLPWSALLIGLAIFFWRRREQLSLRMQPDTVWLVCWSVGGLILMSIIPSKRVDRIFPVLPPLCLLSGAQVAAAFRAERWRKSVEPWLRYALVFACLFTAGYAAWKIASADRENSAALVSFSAKVRREAVQHHWRYEVVGDREEGMLLYLRRDHFLSPNDAIEQWKSGRLDALVVRDEPARPWLEMLTGAELRLASGKGKGLSRYSFFVRSRR